MIDIADIKLDVLKCAMGINALEDRDLYQRLEKFWCEAYTAGCMDTREAVMKAITVNPEVGK